MQNKRIICYKPAARSRHYLVRMGLFNFLNIDPDIPVTKHESAGRFIPLTQIKDSQQLTNFITEMIPLLHAHPDQADPIKYVVSELVRNVFEHSGSSVGAIVCAQFFKTTNRISIGIADTGIGIRNSMSRFHNPSDDLSAIMLALRPGISGTTKRFGGTGTNAGAGLFFIKCIAKINRNFFMVYSGNGMYKLTKTAPRAQILLYADPHQDKSSRRNDMPYLNGTSVGIDISLDSHREFDRLLTMIRDVYRLEVKHKKKQHYKKPRFIS